MVSKTKKIDNQLYPIKTLVVKVGSSAFQNKTNGIDFRQTRKIINDCCHLIDSGTQIILVSSGAILVGRSQVSNPNNSYDISYLQALSAIGQPLLMQQFIQNFRKKNKVCSQVLLTHEDIKRKHRYINLRNTVYQLLAAGVVPIINENDSVSFEEITVGDNDQLAAMISELVEADCLVMLSEHDGLFTSDPRDKKAEKIKNVEFGEGLGHVVLKGKSTGGRGGMSTKVQAVQKLTPLGIPVIIATYSGQTPVSQALNGGGTYFSAAPQSKISKKQRRLSTAMKTDACLKIDRGALDALRKNASLLPAGIKKIVGNFRRGDCIRIVEKNREIGMGLSEYSAKDLLKIAGKGTTEIKNILGHCPAKVAIHKDNLFLKQ